MAEKSGFVSHEKAVAASLGCLGFRGNGEEKYGEND